MQKTTKNILLFISVLFGSVTACAQNSSAQDEYLNSSQEKHGFNNDKWGKLRETITQESHGEFDSGSENQNNEGGFYEHDEEGYDGKYSEYKNDDENYSYEETEEYNQGDGSGDGNGGGYYHPDDETEHGQQEYHPKDEKNKPRYRQKNQSTSGGGGMSWLSYLLAFLLVVLLAFLIYQLFLKSSFDDKGQKIASSFEDVEPTQIPKSELELLLEKALKENDFRSAIRIYFIFIIKDLSEKEWIRWEKKKTNFSYLIEMRNKPQYNSFNETVSIYELVWYGNYTIKKEDYKNIEPQFKSLLNSLKSTNK